jgi:hypothetical protein
VIPALLSRHLINPRYLSLILALLLATAVSAAAADQCPLCKGQLVNVGKITDDESMPSRNLAVWNRSICLNPFYDDDSVICTQCWHSYSKKMERWERSSELADSFRRPLTAGIRRFPLPPRERIKSRVVYSQQFTGPRVTESVLFWCMDSLVVLDSFRDHCGEHHLSIEFYRAESMPAQVCLTITTKPDASP